MLHFIKVRSRHICLVCIQLLFTGLGHSQGDYDFTLDTFKLSGWPALHSFSYAYYKDKVYMFGGRIDGIHEKESGFKKSGSNENLFVWNTVTDQIAKFELSSLPDSILLPLISAGASFVQQENKLVIIGGYGESKTGIFDTYPSLIQIDMDALERVISSHGNFAEAISQIHDPKFRTAGAQLQYLDGKYYLVGGNLFEGEYKSNSGQIKQIYPETAIIFSLEKELNTLQVKFEYQFKDEFNFHRRDYNMVPFVVAPGIIKLMIFSGVFLINENRPFMNLALVDTNGYEDVSNFNQRFAHYHCSKVGIYSLATQEMSEIFFGGMAEYYIDSSGIPSRDPFVPFVKTISKVSRSKDGSYTESHYEHQMPGFLGTNSEFLIHSGIPLYSPGIVDLDKIKADTSFLGLIFGGIYNPTGDPNPWQNNKARLTMANPYLIKVNLVKKTNPNSSKWVYKNKDPKIFLNAIPNPVRNKCQISVEGITWNKLSFWVINPEGDLVFHKRYTTGENPIINFENYTSGWYIIYALVDEKYLIQSKTEKL